MFPHLFPQFELFYKPLVGLLANTVKGTTFSGVAFAFATNNEAKEDIITEWPGAGSYTKQKVRQMSSGAMYLSGHGGESHC
jgi:hypothetical protein